MKYSRWLPILLLFFAAPVFSQQGDAPQPVSGQPDTAALLQKIRDLEDRVISLEGQVRQLKTEAPPVPQATPAPVSAFNTQATTPGKPSSALPTPLPPLWRF